MSNENFKGHETWGQRKGASPTFLMGISVILLCKVYGTVEHTETDFLRYMSGENRFFNPTNTTKCSASWREKLVLLAGLKNLLF